MKMNSYIKIPALYLFVFFTAFNIVPARACSTFKLQHGDQLIYGHNLNEGDMGVPGMVFVNTRGIFKIGRTWTELASPDRRDASNFTWISRYGSVTFNCFGRDFPDGGMNETGLYIWEMNDDPIYPKNEKLPTLNQMNWMQYILDMCSSTNEAIRCAYEFEIEGWGWHYFIGDASGQTAAINFVKGEVIVHTGDQMPVPGLFNTPYDRELELLKYYEGFGGLYPIDMDDPEVTRFAKTAKILKDYAPGTSIINDGFDILSKIMVNDVPEWSVIMDVKNQAVYYKTRLNPAVKSFSMKDLDFSNRSPVLCLNIDQAEGGNVISRFSSFTPAGMKAFFEESLFKVLPESFFSNTGINGAQWAENFSHHTDATGKAENQFFKGSWKDSINEMTVILTVDGDRVKGKISNSTDLYELDHISMVGNHLAGTFKTKGRALIEIQGDIEGSVMDFGFRDTGRSPANKRKLYLKE